jgi:hypothetical protein
VNYRESGRTHKTTEDSDGSDHPWEVATGFVG